MSNKHDTRTALYRHFDAGGRLLYVGISLSAVHRLGQHRDNAHWFSSIARVEIEWLPSRAAALMAEAVAIARENPLHNIHRPAVVDEMKARVWLDPWEANSVRCVGEDLHAVLWQGRQWAVTSYGIECRDGTYAIDAARLSEADWLPHMAEKCWVNFPDFARTLTFARSIHATKFRRVPDRWIVAHAASGACDGFYMYQEDAEGVADDFARQFPDERFLTVPVAFEGSRISGRGLFTLRLDNSPNWIGLERCDSQARPLYAERAAA